MRSIVAIIVDIRRGISVILEHETKTTNTAMKIAYTSLDRLFSRYICLRDACCQFCGKTGGRLEAAQVPTWCKHIMWRTEDNGYWLYQETVDNGVSCKHTVRFYEVGRACPVCAAPKPTAQVVGGFATQEMA